MLDPGTFKEIGSIAGKASYDAKGNITGFIPGNCVFGRGTVDGRPVVIAGDDFTLRGGSADASIKGKPKMSEEIATQFRMPIIRLIEGSGGGEIVVEPLRQHHHRMPRRHTQRRDANLKRRDRQRP